MKEIWNIKIWGVRGSYPTPGTAFAEYGGNTSCISAHWGEHSVILDAGSGLIGLGEQWPPGRKKRLDILFSHLHMDHCVGLFGCRLLHDPEMEIHLYGAAQEGRSFEENLKALLRAPYWPIGFQDFPSSIRVHELKPGESFTLKGDGASSGNLEIHTLRGNHPNQSLLYRLEAGGKSLVYGLDCEMTEEIRPLLRNFSQNTDLLIWDACFTDQELEQYRGWGHSSWRQGAALGRQAGAGMVLMTHYSPKYTDTFLQKQEELAAKTDSPCRFAREGMEICLAPAPGERPAARKAGDDICPNISNII